MVASRGVGEFGGEVIEGVVVLSEFGDKVVELVPLLMGELFEGWTRSDVAGWVGLVWGSLVVLLGGNLGSKELVFSGSVV